jgi:aspartate aminotransferase-like enzyme
MYGGEVTYFESDYQRAIDPVELERFLADNHDFKFATLVHCETPSGITNPVDQLCPLLKRYGIVTVVDSVSAIGGEELQTDEWQMDIVLGGSQKVLSAPPGLTFLSISPVAWERILHRQAPIIGYYANLSLWKDWYAKKWFPYTQPISDLYGFRVAVDRLLAEDAITRHARIATAVRNTLQSAGLQLYPLTGFSNTVTALQVPQGVHFPELYETMLQKHNILIAGSFGFLENKVIRIGHMGENCMDEKIYLTLKALDQTLREYHVPLKGELHKLFVALS